MVKSETDWTEIGKEEAGEGQQDAAKAEEDRQALTPKVLDLMERISEYGYLTMHEVQFIFGNKTWAYKVMKGLRDQGLIADFDTLLSPRTGHHLTAKGYRALVRFGRLKVGRRFLPERYSTFIFRHRMASAKVGLLLEKHPFVREFLPESRLWNRRKRETDKMCDGEFWFQGPGYPKAERVGLEVELSLKNSDKLEESFHQLAKRGDLDQIWWICGDENIRRGLRRDLVRRYLRDQRHFFALLHEFLAARGKAELMESGGALLSIDPDKLTLLSRGPEPTPPASSPASLPTPRLEQRAVPGAFEPIRLPIMIPSQPPEPAPPAPSQPVIEMEIDVFGSLINVFGFLKGKFSGLLEFILSCICREPDYYRRRRDEGMEGDDWFNILTIGMIIIVSLFSLYQKLSKPEHPRKPSTRTTHNRTWR